METKKRIEDNLKCIKDNIAEACQRVRRDPQEIRLVAVTKTVDINAIRALLELGHCELAESRVQELVQRNAMIKESISRHVELPGASDGNRPILPRWHMVGHLQRNKVKQLLPIVEYVHSVDSLRLAEEINTAAARLGLNDKVKIFLQVNTSQEKQKYGLAVGAVVALAEQVETLPNLQTVGLMTMAPLTGDQESCRFCFIRLREIFEEIIDRKVCGPYFRHLSMGMSQDYITAVEEGATMVRIGSALFE
ncbi:MAG: YggS family pyridoxal phosphate-dependent enzyme [Sedimentisphaerales bacterium]|nr:YggS family pyridoxal phosphate-dependent enzyme [Sedimentisphaerales bacterium]